MFSEETIRNVLAVIEPWWQTLFVLAYLIGFVMVGAGLLGLMRQRHSGEGVGSAIAALTFGSILASLPAWLDTLSMSFLGQDSQASLASVAAGRSLSQTALILLASYSVVQLVGLYGVVKGLILFRQSADTRDRLGSAFVHTIGGAVCLNLVAIMSAVAKTLGGGAGDAINQILPAI